MKNMLMATIAAVSIAGCATFTCPDAHPDIEIGVRPNSVPGSVAVRCQGEADWRYKAYTDDSGVVAPFLCEDGEWITDGPYAECVEPSLPVDGE